MNSKNLKDSDVGRVFQIKDIECGDVIRINFENNDARRKQQNFCKIDTSNRFIATDSIISMPFDSEERNNEDESIKESGCGIYHLSNVYQFLNRASKEAYKPLSETDELSYRLTNTSPFLSWFTPEIFECLMEMNTVSIIPKGLTRKLGKSKNLIELATLPTHDDFRLYKNEDGSAWHWDNCGVGRWFKNSEHASKSRAGKSTNDFSGRRSESCNKSNGVTPIIKLNGDAYVTVVKDTAYRWSEQYYFKLVGMEDKSFTINPDEIRSFF